MTTATMTAETEHPHVRGGAPRRSPHGTSSPPTRGCSGARMTTATTAEIFPADTGVLRFLQRR
ncbi:hypothetical protein OG478_00570 [Streptomyces phaeochromogenes]|uniref:hypothetical protein n=1 Tax=Streptomyces phaeochromogenes TaxID=1923 RepID=UPI00386ABA8D|nr:hypothetical protein OG478_00570 [Streptomyces phaeochromogenes]